MPYGNATCESAKLGIQGVICASACDSYTGGALNFKSVHEILCELRIDLNSGPDSINTDFALIKHSIFLYRDGMRLDFGAEFFNVF